MAVAGGTVANEVKWYSRVAQAISSVTNKISKPENFPEAKCSGRYASDMPNIRVAPLRSKIISAATGPNAGLCQLDLRLETFPSDGNYIAGINNWQSGKNHAEGVSTSLYDRVPGKDQHSGDPVADVFGVVSFDNSGILAIADGVNWGHKPRLAARCAVNGAISYIIGRLYGSDTSYPHTTHDIFHTILRSFEAAQQLILQHEATTTTLCVAVVCELMPTKGSTRWGCCVVCLGDSLAYIYRRATGIVEEMTSFSHYDVTRDLRDCGGCLGPHVGTDPDVENMFCVFAPVEEHDVVFLVTDGVSDNFDPVVRKEALPSPTKNTRAYYTVDSDPETPVDTVSPPSLGQDPEQSKALPFLTPPERHDHALKLMSNVIHRFSSSDLALIDAINIATHLVTDCYNTTERHRQYLEQNAVPSDCTPEERRQSYREIKKALKALPGKLDHATAVAYEVQQHSNNFVHIETPKSKMPPPKVKSFDHQVVSNRKRVETKERTETF